MARYYQTSDSPFLDDAMFQMPVDLMARAVEVKDKLVNKNIDETIALGQYLNVDPLEVDRDRANQRVSGYQNKIDGLVNTIINSPDGNYRQAIQTLQREVYDDYSKGHLARINTNKKDYVAWEQQLMKQVEKNPENYNPLKLASLKARQMAMYADQGGYHDENRGLQGFTSAEMFGTDPIPVHVKKAFEEKVGKVTEIKRDNATGNWRYVTDIKKEGWTENEIRDQLHSYVEARPDLKAALHQDMELGLLNVKNYPDHLFDYAKSTYLKKTTLDSTKTELSDQGKHELANGLERPVTAVEDVRYQDLTKFGTTTEMFSYLNDVRYAPSNNLSTLREELKALKGKDTLPDGTPTAEADFEKVVANLYADDKSRQQAINRQKELERQSFFAEGKREHLSKVSDEEYKNLTKGKTNLTEEQRAYFRRKADAIALKRTQEKPAQVLETVMTWEGTGTTTPAIKSLQTQVQGNLGVMPISNVHSFSMKVKDASGVPLYFATPSTSGLKGNLNNVQNGEFVVTAPDGKGGTRVVILDSQMQQTIKNTLDLFIGNKKAAINEETLEANKKIVAAKLGVNASDVSIAKFHRFNTENVKAKDLVAAGAMVTSYDTEKQTPLILHANGNWVPDSEDAPTGTFKERSKHAIEFKTETYAPIHGIGDSQGNAGFGIKVSLGKGGTETTAFVPSGVDGATTLPSAEQFFQTQRTQRELQTSLSSLGVEVSNSGKISGFNLPNGTKVLVKGTPASVDIVDGYLLLDGARVISKPYVEAVLDALSRSADIKK